MKRIINRHPGRAARVLLGILPFALLVVSYIIASHYRLELNPNDKLLPSFGKMADAMQRMAFEPSKRTGEYLFWKDTASSLTRLLEGIGIAALIGLLFGISTGAIPAMRAFFAPFMSVLSMIPPMAVLPILFIVFGLGELSKVMLIVIGISPIIMRDLYQRTMELPHEEIIKAQTLGASSWQMILRVIVPQIMPRLLDSVRLTLGTAWLFLIGAEAVASEDGLGYRIFLVRRYLAMDVILPYVAWITMLAYTMDFSLKQLNQILFPWYDGNKR